MKPEINPYDNMIGGLIVVRRIVIALVVIVSVVIGVGSGCRLGTPDFPQTNGGAVTNSGGRPWKSGLVLTFQNEPAPEVKELMAVAGAVRESGEAHGHRDVIFVIQRYDRFNASQNAALEAALREGAKVTGR